MELTTVMIVGLAMLETNMVVVAVVVIVKSK